MSLETFNPPDVDPKLVEAAIAIGAGGYAAYSNSLVGGQASKVRAYYERVKAPQPGDLVLETSSFQLRIAHNEHPEICLGTLHEVKREFTAWDEESYTEEDPGYWETATYIQYWVDPLPARLARWVNAMFIAVPRTPAEAWAWEGR